MDREDALKCLPLGRVTHVTSVHAPLDSRIYDKECRTLAMAGYNVTIVAPHDADEIIDGLQIRAVRKPKGRFQRITQTVPAVYRAALSSTSHIFHLHDPELMPLALLLRLQGKRVIYDVHEDVPQDVLTKDYIPAPIRRLVSWLVWTLQKASSKGFSAFVAATPTIARYIPADRTIVFHN